MVLSLGHPLFPQAQGGHAGWAVIPLSEEIEKETELPPTGISQSLDKRDRLPPVGGAKSGPVLLPRAHERVYTHPSPKLWL